MHRACWSAIRVQMYSITLSTVWEVQFVSCCASVVALVHKNFNSVRILSLSSQSLAYPELKISQLVRLNCLYFSTENEAFIQHLFFNCYIYSNTIEIETVNLAMNKSSKQEDRLHDSRFLPFSFRKKWKWVRDNHK